VQQILSFCDFWRATITSPMAVADKAQQIASNSPVLRIEVRENSGPENKGISDDEGSDQKTIYS
jgi:hypothetical protein